MFRVFVSIVAFAMLLTGCGGGQTVETEKTQEQAYNAVLQSIQGGAAYAMLYKPPIGSIIFEKEVGQFIRLTMPYKDGQDVIEILFEPNDNGGSIVRIKADIDGGEVTALGDNMGLSYKKVMNHLEATITRIVNPMAEVEIVAPVGIAETAIMLAAVRNAYSESQLSSAFMGRSGLDAGFVSNRPQQTKMGESNGYGQATSPAQGAAGSGSMGQGKPQFGSAPEAKENTYGAPTMGAN